MPEITVMLLLRVAASFLLGSVPFAVLAMSGSGIDIRTVGSGNPGFNNVLRVSKKRAVLCLIGDLGKGVLAILAFYRPGEPMTVAWMLAFAVMLGHCYSPFLKFNGGKGVSTSAGVMLVLYVKPAVVCVAAYVLLRVLGKKRGWKEGGALASLSSWLLFAVLLLPVEGAREAVFAAVMFAIIAWRHKSNLSRLAAAVRA